MQQPAQFWVGTGFAATFLVFLIYGISKGKDLNSRQRLTLRILSSIFGGISAAFIVAFFNPYGELTAGAAGFAIFFVTWFTFRPGYTYRVTGGACAQGEHVDIDYATVESAESLPPSSPPSSPPRPPPLPPPVPPASGTPENRVINVTGHSLDGGAVSHFSQGERYRIRFRVGPPSVENLASGDTSVRDVPREGLKTHWVVSSTDIQFVDSDSTVKVQKIEETWLAEFDLLIPETGSSQTAEVNMLGSGDPGRLLLTIYAVSADNRLELYREVSVSLVDQPAVKHDETCKAPLHTHLRTTHEGTTPPEHIQVSIANGVAAISTKRVRLEDYVFIEPFRATATSISGAIEHVRDSLEKLRETHEDYLNDLDHTDIGSD